MRPYVAVAAVFLGVGLLPAAVELAAGHIFQAVIVSQTILFITTLILAGRENCAR